MKIDTNFQLQIKSSFTGPLVGYKGICDVSYIYTYTFQKPYLITEKSNVSLVDYLTH